jgi:CheY-like chemotaxis protein/two-component sensor histidine kinase
LLHKEQTSRQLLDDAAHMKDQFLAALSHELRTPLSAILLWAKALRDIKVAPEQVEAGLNAIVRNAEAQSRLIEDLMDTSRIVTGKLRLEIGEVDLAKVIEAAVQSVEPGIRAKHLQITKTLDPGLGVVRADPERLQQVLWNLLSNALKFTEKGGITLTVRRNGKDVEIIVSDTGTGIDGEFLPFVFERFRQKDGSVSKKSMGLGLGLAITKQLVELHGGAIRVTSGGLNKGATFTVRIPMPAVRGSAPVKSAALALETKPLLGAKILLIEDDAASREIMELLLRQAGADVVAVGTAASAMEEFARSRPTLLISDIGLPEIDGYSLLENIRALEARGQSSPVPAIAMTAHAREEHRARAIEVGYNTHFSKPVDIERLISILADFVRDATQSGNDKHGKN